jgi:hypothetical protein
MKHWLAYTEPHYGSRINAMNYNSLPVEFVALSR